MVIKYSSVFNYSRSTSRSNFVHRPDKYLWRISTRRESLFVDGIRFCRARRMFHACSLQFAYIDPWIAFLIRFRTCKLFRQGILRAALSSVFSRVWLDCQCRHCCSHAIKYWTFPSGFHSPVNEAVLFFYGHMFPDCVGKSFFHSAKNNGKFQVSLHCLLRSR